MKVKIRYFASLREKAEFEFEEIETDAKSLRELFEERKLALGFNLDSSLLKASIDAEFVSLNHPVENGQIIVFMPPVAGG